MKGVRFGQMNWFMKIGLVMTAIDGFAIMTTAAMGLCMEIIAMWREPRERFRCVNTCGKCGHVWPDA
jgi:hypothetical protein